MLHIGIVSTKNYKEEINETKRFGAVVQVDSIDKLNHANVTLEAVLLDDESITTKDFEHVRKIIPAEKPVFYHMKNIRTDLVMQKVSRFCALHNITLLKEGLTVNQVINEMSKQLLKEDFIASNRVVSLFGTHSGAGVSTTTFNLAKALSERINERILVLSLNTWDPADYFYKYKGEYLNEIKSELSSKTLTTDRLLEAVHDNGHFLHLAGNKDIKIQRYYQAEEIEHLITISKEIADVILIDSGPHFDNACATQAFLSARIKLLVTTQEEKGYKGYFPHVFEQLIKPHGSKSDDFLMVLNKHQPEMSLINEKDLELALDMERATTIPDMSTDSLVAIKTDKFLYDVASNIYRKPLDNLSNLIIGECNLQTKANEPGTKSKSFFKFGFSKKGFERA